MRDKELGEMKELNTKGKFTGRYLKRIKQRLWKKKKTETVQEKFLLLLFGSVFKEGIVQVQRQVRMPHSVRVCSVSHEGWGSTLSEDCRVLFLNMKNSEVENLWGVVFCSLWRILFSLCLWLLSKPSKKLSSGYISYIVLKQWHMETLTYSERFYVLECSLKTSAGLRCFYVDILLLDSPLWCKLPFFIFLDYWESIKIRNRLPKDNHL